MIGRDKFRWQTEISPAAEWFDLDRGDEMPDDYMNERNIDYFENIEVPPETQQNTPIFDDDFDDDDDDDEQLACPKCGGEDVFFVEDVRDDTGIVGQRYRCGACKNQFNIYDGDDGFN